jgi:hypothetical protein
MLFFLITLLSSCIDKNYDLNNISSDASLNNMSLGFPIGTLNNSLQDILNKMKIKGLTISGDSIYLIYRDTLNLTSSNTVTITPSPAVYTNAFAPATGSDFLLNTKSYFSLSSSLDKLDSVSLVNSQIELVVHSGLSTNAQFKLILPAGMALKNPSDGTFTVAPGVTTKYIDVKDSTVARIDNSGAFPSVAFQYELKTPSSVTLSTNEVSVDFNFSKFNTDVMWGTFGDTFFGEQNNTINIDFFNNVMPKGSVLHFSDPIIKCTALNYVGVNSIFKVNYIKATSKTGQTVYAQFNNQTTQTYSFNLAAATVPHKYTPTTQIFDRQTGGTYQLFLIEPSTLSYSFSNQTIPVAGQNNFVVANKYVNVLLETKLPFSFDEGSLLVTNDTLNLDLTGQGKINDVNNAILRINYANRLPVAATISAVFLDANHSVITSLTKSFNLISAPINSLGYTTGETDGSLYIKFDTANFTDATKVKYVNLKTLITGADANSKISFSPTDFIHLKIDLFATGDIKIQ